MATKIKTWEINNGKLKEINETMKDNGRKEREHLEKWIKTEEKILGDDIWIIGEQVYTASGPLDFLGIDRNGNIVIIELKRDILPREALAQAIDYASDIARWDIDKISEVCIQYNEMTLEEFLVDKIDNVDLEDIVVNSNQRVLLVGFGIDEALNRMIEYLSNNFDISINALILNYIKTKSGDELLSKVAVISEEVEELKANKKKFKIQMSDEPGTYSKEELLVNLEKYFNKDLYSSRRIRNVLLPLLLNKAIVTRNQLKKEFVKLGKAEDESQAGYFISLISNQLGQKKKDYLRQIIKYEYPRHDWEKDNFQIREGYQTIVEAILKK